MSLADLSRSDNRDILDMDGERATLTSPAGVPYPDIPCRFIRRGAVRDIDGTFAIVGEEVAVSISILALSEKGITDPEVLKDKGWKASINGVPYRLVECPIDYMNGVATAVLKGGGLSA